MFRKILFAGAGLSALWSTPCLAQSTDDVRCLVLSNAFAKIGSTAEAKKAGESGAVFYLGKIDGRWNDAQLRAAIAQHQKTLKVPNAGPEMKVCMQRMQASYEKLQALAPPPVQPRK